MLIIARSVILVLMFEGLEGNRRKRSRDVGLASSFEARMQGRLCCVGY